ncbi:Mesogenin-1 [Trichinella pseudospiralis]
MLNNECYVSSNDQPIGRAKLFSDHWTGFSDLPTKISALHYPSIGRRPNTNFQFGLTSSETIHQPTVEIPRSTKAIH